jgi:outer membrane protein OmpA-like peptidoglycan-associated protein
MIKKHVTVAALAAFVWSGAALAAAPTVTTIAYPEKETVSLVFEKTSAAPAKAKVSGAVKYENGQAKVSLSYDNMEPAVLFGGDIAAYVVWAVAKSANPENLGELVVTKKAASGSQTYSTGKKDFAIIITAEPYYLVSRPFDLVIAASAAKDTKKYPGSRWVFQDFRPGPIAGVPSIATLKYEDKTAVPIKQAEAVLTLIDRLHAGDVNPGAVKAATVALGEAKAAKDSKAVSDAARRSISSSAEALREWGRSREELAASEAAARVAADKEALEKQNAETRAKLSTTQSQLTITEQAKAQLARQREELIKERDAIAQDRAAVTAERDALAAKLSGALGQVADTRQTARGTVTSLSGVLFDTGKSALKPDAKITLAKLAGVMLVFSKTNMTIEGYTDNTGSEAANLKLSEDRAKAVRDFFEAQGIASNRLTYAGKGPADPVASNDTPDGRAKNRRVEVISSEPAL